jgi:hypothetical protein
MVNRWSVLWLLVALAGMAGVAIGNWSCLATIVIGVIMMILNSTNEDEQSNQD